MILIIGMGSTFILYAVIFIYQIQRIAEKER